MSEQENSTIFRRDEYDIIKEIRIALSLGIDVKALIEEAKAYSEQLHSKSL